MSRVPPKTPERLAVEAALRRGTAERPITVRDVIQRTGLSKDMARRHVSNIVAAGECHNVFAGSRYGAYAWGMEQAKPRGDVAGPRLPHSTEEWKPKPWFVPRAA